MRNFFQSKKRVVWVAVGLCVIALIMARASFLCARMDSPSMEPVVKGNTTPQSHDGDCVVAWRWFRGASLRSGDLVLVDIPTPTGQVRTIRQIEQQPGIPVGQFYLRAVSTNGLDSRRFGTLPAQAIRGRVVWILKTR